MKYADSFHYTKTFTNTSGETVYSDWFDISWANLLYSYITLSATETYNSETVDVTVQRHLPYVTPSAGTVLAHGQLTADQAGAEIYMRASYDGDAPAADNKLGMRVRWEIQTGGTWTSGQDLTVTLTMYAKRV